MRHVIKTPITNIEENLISCIKGHAMKFYRIAHTFTRYLVNFEFLEYYKYIFSRIKTQKKKKELTIFTNPLNLIII